VALLLGRDKKAGTFTDFCFSQMREIKAYLWRHGVTASQHRAIFPVVEIKGKK
jgi:DNA-binding ferritin-like protein (Dps family)